MPLDIYRRHVKTCRYFGKGLKHRDCNCPVWVNGPHPETRRRVRCSLGTRDWSRGMRILVEWEQGKGGIDIARMAGPKLADGIKAYLADCRARQLAPGTLRNLSNSLQHFARLAKTDYAGEITVETIREFRNKRAAEPGRKAQLTSARSLRKEIEHLRTFCEFCIESEWLQVNPARRVKPPRDEAIPTMPFTPTEVKAIIAACDTIDNPNPREIPRARVRARALILLLLYSGLRISDAVKLERSRLDSNGRLLIRMEKTREPLYVRLPATVLQALAAVPVESIYFFWTGRSALTTAVGSARRTIGCVLGLADVKGHPHRFRDTFSVELLKSGADLRTVQKLLGHTSIKTTEKHYAPWVRDFQRQLDAATKKLKFG